MGKQARLVIPGSTSCLMYPNFRREPTADGFLLEEGLFCLCSLRSCAWGLEKV